MTATDLTVPFRMARLNNKQLRRREEQESVIALTTFIQTAISFFRLYLFILSTARYPRPSFAQNPEYYQTQVNDVNRLVNGNEEDCHEQLRVNRFTFLRLCCLVRSVGLGDSRFVCVEERVAIFLWILRHHTKQRRTKFAFWRSIETISQHFNPILQAVLRLHKMLLERSATDSRILRDTIASPNGLKVPHGHYYIVDGGYTNGECFLAPYCGERYHLNIWRSPSYYPIWTQCRIVTICCLLHNLIKREMPNDLVEFEYTRWEQENLHNIKIDDDCVTTIEASNEWTGERDALATAMYNHWLSNGGGQEFQFLDTDTQQGFEEANVSTKKIPRSRRNWRKVEENALIKVMLDEFLDKWSDDNGFKPGFFSSLEKQLDKVLPESHLKVDPHIESKVKYWRQTYNKVFDILQLSGFGWDHTNKKVKVVQSVRDEYEKAHPKKAKEVYGKTFPYYDDWAILFGRDRATEAGAEDPTQMEQVYTPNPLQDSVVDDVEDFYAPLFDDQFMNSPYGRKRTRMGDVEDVRESLGHWCKESLGYMEKLANSLGYEKELATRHATIPGELEKLNLTLIQQFKLASIIGDKEERVDQFLNTRDERKQAWTEAVLNGDVYSPIP
ncbi:hypothetical protein Acr_00g0024850 [Actinidia rufa]|uniref:Myb/SANT-like domain-containing protein n=1 Tax=Actinidia rufa TaxID=165716 RepID=A0A7J0DF16_9ERIC|nr:hypothetical protein Acr_00g0024850 [Actinidia rufa]